MSERPVTLESLATTEEDRLRAQAYRLLGALLANPPGAETLATIAGLEGDETDLGQALTALGRAAGTFSPAAIDDEFHALFIGMGRGELMPYGSYYLTGFAYEKPLARLRIDMAALGVARAETSSEPEDHIASLCEIMAGLIEGDFDAPVDLAGQRDFFDAHLGPWVARFFGDLEAAKAAGFYMAVGQVGRVFAGIESTAFEMAA